MNRENKVYTFSSILTKLQAWTIAPLPKDFTIEAVHPFGRTPVIATVKDKKWKTSLWTEKSGESMIAVPKKIRRGSLKEGDEIEISFIYDYDRF